MKRLKKYPDLKVLETVDDNGDTGIAADKTSTLLHGKTKIDGIIALEASGRRGRGGGSAPARPRWKNFDRGV
jgi:ABC-type sugar transport system substrate-binding protein